MKPTPPQARLLKALLEPGATITGFDHMRLNTANGSKAIARSTMTVAQQKRWIEPVAEGMREGLLGSRYLPTFILTDFGRMLAERLPESALVSPPKVKPPMTAFQITGLLRRRHVPPESFLAVNFSVAGDVADAVAFHLYSPHRSTAYEIKVTRGDLRRELANPNKNRNIRSVVDEFVFVCPAHLIKPEEIPPADGLVYAWPSGLRIVKRAVPRHPLPDVNRLLVAALLRRRDRDEREAIRVADLLGQIVEQAHDRAPQAFPSYWRGEVLKQLVRRAANLMSAAVAAGIIDERARV